MTDPRTEYPPVTPETKLGPTCPTYFLRVYGGASDQPGELPDNVFDTRVSFPTTPLHIYGYAIRSRYAEDIDSERWSWEHRRTFLSNCFSLIEPDGELGFTPAPEASPFVQEITKEQFEAAMARGWKP